MCESELWTVLIGDDLINIKNQLEKHFSPL